nr:MAG TPA: Flagellar and Swarming motility protein [Caudoviricetes sp.]
MKLQRRCRSQQKRTEVAKMADFIEVHQLGKPRLVNLGLVEEIWPTENGTQIYFAFTCPDATSQDFITTDESYDKIKRIMAYQRVERG